MGPPDNVTAIYYQFGFVLALGDSLDISYNVSQGSSDVVNIQIHVHIGNLTKLFMNVTQGSYRTILGVTLELTGMIVGVNRINLVGSSSLTRSSRVPRRQGFVPSQSV